MKYQNVLEGLRRIIADTLARECPGSLLSRSGETALRAVIATTHEEATLAAGRICMQADLFLRGLYDREDAERGYVVTRLAADGGEIHVPLLRVEATVKPESHTA